MKRITEIFRALRVLSRTPSKTIADAWHAVRTSALPHRDSGTLPADGPFMQAITLIDNIITAVTAHAAEDEAKQAAAAEALAAEKFAP